MTPEWSLGELARVADSVDGLRTTARAVLGRAWSLDRFRDALDGEGPVFDTNLWELIRSLGWCDVLVSEDHGGPGASILEVCALAEEAGAAAAPVPLASSAAAAWCANQPVEGMPLVVVGSPGHCGDKAFAKVSGRWPVVPYGAVATSLIIGAVTPDGSDAIVAVNPDQVGVDRTLLRPLDHGPAAAITCSEAEVERVIASGAGAGTQWQATGRIVTLASIAELVGVASAAHEAACEYAKVRVAFGRPIGSFQAIKHRLVDQRAAIEVARALVARAAFACEETHPDADALTSLAAFWAIESLRAIPEGAIQVFGGIAYTWEHHAHLHLRRAACIAATLGSRSAHRQRVMQWLIESRSP